MKTCIITGASSGIGQAAAIAISDAGIFDHLALLGRDMDALMDTRQKMADGCAISLHPADLSQPETLPEIVENIFAQTGSVDCLLNIAGVTAPQSLLETSLENLQTTYNVNVFAPLILTRACVRYMKRSGGKILNVASTAGMSPRPGWISYSSSKAAVISISQTVTEELADYGIRVYCVSPGRCATKLRKILAPDEDPSTIMQPEEVAQVICRLVSEEEHCLDGQNIVIRKKHT